MPRVCLICDLHPLLERWAESLIEKDLPLRRVAAGMRDHGIRLGIRRPKIPEVHGEEVSSQIEQTDHSGVPFYRRAV